MIEKMYVKIYFGLVHRLCLDLVQSSITSLPLIEILQLYFDTIYILRQNDNIKVTAKKYESKS